VFGQVWKSKLSCSATLELYLRLLLAAIMLPSLAFAQSRTDWQMHDGYEAANGWPAGIITSLTSCPNGAAPTHGNICLYADATVPSLNDAGWFGAPNPDIIGFSIYSRLCHRVACLRGADFTYFQTFVDVPANVAVDTFRIAFSGMDDGSRITIFNSRYLNGYVVPGSYVYLGGRGTTDLSSLVISGETNRVVVTQVDDCCSGNNLRSAHIVLNGQIVVSNDGDGDGVLVGQDNCEDVYNPVQADLDEDGIGDACDVDVDGDGIDDEFDNCPLVANSDQIDFDSDGVGYACDADECLPSGPGAIDLQGLMGPVLYEQAVFANTYVSAGAGTGSEMVHGNILANTYVTTGAGSTVDGSVQTGTILTTGASATVSGDTLAVGPTTLGASSVVEGDVRSGTAVTLGAGGQVGGTTEYGTTITNGAGAISGAEVLNTTAPVVIDESQDVSDAQDTLDAMTSTVVLTPGNIATDTTFTAGIYEVAGLLTVTANKTITLDAEGQDSLFVFNVGSYLTFGADVNVVVVNGTDNTRVIWNATGKYVSIGANATIVGVILAKEYVSTGAASSVSGAGSSCGAVYSSTSYVSLGADATVGSDAACGAAVEPVCGPVVVSR
jgi:hypothetical protein